MLKKTTSYFLSMYARKMANIERCIVYSEHMHFYSFIGSSYEKACIAGV